MRYDGLFHKWQARCLLLLLIVPIAGCTSFFVDPDRTRPRDYELIVQSADDEPILKVVCSYLGKGGLLQSKNGDLPSRRADYYNYNFINLTDLPIRFHSIASYSKYPSKFTWYHQGKAGPQETTTTPGPLHRDLRQYPLWDGNLLESGESRTMKNIFYYAGLPFDIRFHDVTFAWRKTTHTFTIYEIYTMQDDLDN